MHFDRGAFDDFIIENDVVGFFDKPVTLKSGRISHWYVNWRKVAGDAYLVDCLADYLLAFCRDLELNPDGFYGVPEGATKLGVISTYKLAKSSGRFAKGSHCLSMGRAKPKEHGVPADRYFVGAPSGQVVVVEDVTTTGGSLISELAKLKEAAVNVVAAIGLTNRMELASDGRSVKDAVNAAGVRYHALSDATSFLPVAYAKKAPGAEIGKAIEDEFNRYGVSPLTLLK